MKYTAVEYKDSGEAPSDDAVVRQVSLVSRQAGAS